MKLLLEKNGVKHSVGMMPVDTKDSPYVHTGKNGFTYVFVIGRDGKIAWKGNHAVKEKDFLKAVGKALAVKPVPALERTLDPALESAVDRYYESRFLESRAAAQKVMDKHARKTSQTAAGIVEDAAYLMERVDAVEAEFLERLNASLESKDTLAFVETADVLAAGFPGSEAAGQARELEQKAAEDEDFRIQIKAARSWIALLEKRPVLFPATPDSASKSYAKKLENFMKSCEGLPPAQEAARLLERFSGS